MTQRQEQEEARPEVTEVAPNVLRMQLPISMPGLGHVNCYALIDGQGAALVDPGLPGTASWRALQDRLKQAGVRLEARAHRDRHALASRPLRRRDALRARVRRARGRPPQLPLRPARRRDPGGLGRAPGREASSEAATAAPGRASRPRSPRRAAGASVPGTARRRGAASAPRPPFKQRMRWRMMRTFGGGDFVPEISDPVENGNVLRLAGRDWFVLHTPGHTEDHICLHDPELGIFLGGDHVLPSITPHISGISSSRDPLASFFYSLDRVAEINGIKHALPAHGHPFTDLKARTEAIKRHHFERLEKIREISRELGPASVEDISKKLFKPRSWGSMAESETYAHLEHLRLAGQAESQRDGEQARSYNAGLTAPMKAIFWDNDGVLVRQRAPVLRGDARSDRGAGRRAHARRLRGAVTAHGQERLRRRGGSRDRAGADRGRARLRRNARYGERLAGVELIPGVREALAALHGRVPMAVVTTSRRVHFEIQHARTARCVLRVRADQGGLHPLQARSAALPRFAVAARLASNRPTVW